MNGYGLIDLFSGAGGMTLGFHDAGFKSIQAVDADEAAAATYARNFGCDVISRPIEQVRKFPEADIVIGGPPCQGFSPLGRGRDSSSRALLNRLWTEYVRALRQTRPAVFVIENVPEFVRSAQFQRFLVFCRRDRLLARYRVEHRILNAADFGVAQRRRRAVVLASRIGSPIWPEPTHGPTLLATSPYKTVRDAIGDIPLQPDGRNWHIGRSPTTKSLERYKAIPEGGNRFDLGRNRPDLLPECWKRKKTGTTDVFGRLWWDKPALTIRTEFFKPEKGRYLHPQADRPITHREAARLQSFPDDFVFEGTRIEVARHIGNAVPPLLAYSLAVAIRKLIGAADARSA